MRKIKIVAIVLAAVLAVAALVCFFSPKKAVRALHIPEESAAIRAEVVTGLSDPVRYNAETEQEQRAVMICLQELKLRPLGTDGDEWATKSNETARVTLTLSSGEEIEFSFAVSGEVRRGKRSYTAINTAPLEALMTQIKTWSISG